MNLTMRCLRRALPVLAGILLTTTTLWPQSATTSGITGRVTNAQGGAIPDAVIQATHQPSGTTTSTTVQPNGRFVLRNLRVGGPFLIEVSAEGYRRAAVENVFTFLGEQAEINLSLEDGDVVELGAYVVDVRQEDEVFRADSISSRTTVGEGLLRSLPSVTRSINDIVRMDPTITVIDRDRGQISAGGQNNRFNSINVDGVPTNDPFGLNDNGVPSLDGTQPFSLETIEQITVSTNPYSVRDSGFTGAAINAVSKSGGNDFSGSVYTFYRNKDLVSNKLDGVSSPLDGYRDWTWGLTLGGPVLPNRLFFFLNWEDRTQTKPSSTARRYTPTDAIISEINAIAKSFNPDFVAGDLSIPANELRDKKRSLRLDWNISQQHRANVRYTYNDGKEPRVSNSSPTASLTVSSQGNTAANRAPLTSLNSHYYDQSIKNEAWVGQILSYWTPELSTDFNVSFSKYDSVPLGVADYPLVDVKIDGTNFLRFGPEQFRHANVLQTETLTMDLNVDYVLGDHTLSVGAELLSTDVYNLFLERSRGYYLFDSVADFRAGTPRVYQYRFARPGFNPAAEYRITTYSLYAQDQWQINPQLRLFFGLRLDLEDLNSSPDANTGFGGRSFRDIFGYENTATIDGESILQPRLGFNYDVRGDRTLQVRGGIGYFYGKTPAVWLANSFTNNGMSIGEYDLNSAINPVPGFSGDINNQPGANEASVRMGVDLMDPDFQLPSMWKGNLALDYEVPVLGGLVATAEFTYSKVDKGLHYEHLNLKPMLDAAGRHVQGPDGRFLYEGNRREAGYSDVLLLTNSSQGHASNLTFALERFRKADGFSGKLAYSLGRATDSNPGTSSRAISNYNNRIVFNQNEDLRNTSIYEIRHRFIARASYQFELVRDFKTTVTLVYEGRSGRPYTYTFDTDLNGDTRNNNDVLYVPTFDGNGRLNDPLVRFDTAANEQAFYDYITSRGIGPGVQKINGEREPWLHTFDLSFAQEIPVWKNHKIEVTLDVFNLGNLLKKTWGITRESDFPREVGVVRASYDKATGQYVYSGLGSDAGNEFNTNTGGDQLGFANRWSVLLGVRYSF